MKSRNLINLALAAALAILAAVAFFEPGKDEPETPPELLALAPDTVQSIVIRHQDQSEVQLRRRDGGWQVQMAADTWLPASRFKVAGLLRLPNTASHASFPAATDELGKYGLDEPSPRVILDGTEVVFGDTEPLNNRRYVLIGDTVHLINDSFYQHVASAQTTFVDTALLPGSPAMATLTLPGLVLTKGDDGAWRAQPAKGSADALTGLVDEWRHAQALEVEPFTGATGQETIHIGLENGDQVNLTVIERSPELVLARPEWGIQYRFSSQTARRLLEPAVHEPPDPQDPQP